MTTKPLSPLLNNVAGIMADRCLPCGWDVRPDAPNTFDDVKREYHHTGRISIWEGDYGSGFGDLETWRAFRAWHDYVHIRYDFPFTLGGEWGAAAFQSFQIFRICGRDEAAIQAVAQMWAELVHPLEVKALGCKARPIECQWSFTRDHTADWVPLARRLAQLPVDHTPAALAEARKVQAQRETW